MRTFASIIAVVAGLTVCASAGGQELAVNGGFEQPCGTGLLTGLDAHAREFYAGTAESPFEGWTFGGGWDKGEYTIHASADAHGGKQSGQITCVKKGRGGIACSPINLHPGTILEVSLWIKAKGADNGRVVLNFEGGPGDGWASSDLPSGTFDWTKVTRRVVVRGSKKNAGEQTIVIFLYSKAEGSVWIDDFSVRMLDVNAMADAPDTPALQPKMPAPLAEPADSAGYRLNVVSTLEKVFQEDDFAAAPCRRAEACMARNEYESLQVVIEAPWREVKVRQVELSGLKGPGGAVIPASAMKWERVDYVETLITPAYPTLRGPNGYPDPLIPAGPFTVEKNSRTPVWITLKTSKDVPAGEYKGTITVVPDGLKPSTVEVTVKVWDFALTDQTHLRTLTWMGVGSLRAWYQYGGDPESTKKAGEMSRRYEDFLLEHRIGPGGEVAAHVPMRQGKYDFGQVDERLERLIGKGMNAFFMGTAPNLRRAGQKEYTPQFVSQFTGMLKAYYDHLVQKGWADLAYVYVYDEAPRSAWPEVKKIDRAIKSAAPQARILQCLNQPEGVKELTGFADVFDVYIAQYHMAGVAESQKKGAEVWLAVCCYPMEHPNLFVEYPLVDARAIFWLCWKYGANGFEYWSTTSWGSNVKKPGEARYPDVSWNPNTFGRYNGDGQLIYPGPDGVPWSSIRLEALRDGLEDYEYFWTLDGLLRQAHKADKTGPAVNAAAKLVILEPVVQPSGSYDMKPESFTAMRQQVAEAIVTLQAALKSK